ncbi:hypothetical protein [Schlesneria paludicola]|uniref:hypothetical protein n=1 Tax=Schlesneria paludicola TaxID=360056 RepID=UPI000299E2C2|nr:hypothetical protein [Schlesneria paludicola]
MRRMNCCASLLVLMSSTFLGAEETVQPRKQRVSPKLLRQAMSLPEYRAQAPGGKPACHVDDVAKLADKLKKSGDIEGAELLQQFIAAHQQLMNQVGVQRTATAESIAMELQVFEVIGADVPESSVLRGSSLIDSAGEKQTELSRLLEAKKATVLITPISIETTANQPIRLSESGDGVSPRFANGSTPPKAGLAIEILPSTSETHNLKLQTTCEFHHKGLGRSKQDAPETVEKLQVNIDANYGDTLVISHSSTKQGHLYFVVLTPTRKN